VELHDLTQSVKLFLRQSLVRIILWETAGGDDAAVSAASGLARNFYPLLREHLPR
jgi:hypothetical protein